MSTPNSTAIARYTIQYDLSGLEDPTVVPTEAAYGSTYRMLQLNTPKFFIKLDDGKTTNWREIFYTIAGVNLGTGAQVLKNIVGNQLQLRTIKAGSRIQVDQLANEIQISYLPDLKDRILEAFDRVTTYIFSNPGACNQLINQIEYTALSVSPTAKAVKAFTYSDTSFKYAISAVNWIVTP